MGGQWNCNEKFPANIDCEIALFRMVIADKQVDNNFSTMQRIAEIAQTFNNFFLIARVNVKKHTDILVI